MCAITVATQWLHGRAGECCGAFIETTIQAGEGSSHSAEACLSRTENPFRPLMHQLPPPGRHALSLTLNLNPDLSGEGRETRGVPYGGY